MKSPLHLRRLSHAGSKREEPVVTWPASMPSLRWGGGLTDGLGVVAEAVVPGPEVERSEGSNGQTGEADAELGIPGCCFARVHGSSLPSCWPAALIERILANIDQADAVAVRHWFGAPSRHPLGPRIPAGPHRPGQVLSQVREPAGPPDGHQGGQRRPAILGLLHLPPVQVHPAHLRAGGADAGLTSARCRSQFGARGLAAHRSLGWRRPGHPQRRWPVDHREFRWWHPSHS